MRRARYALLMGCLVLPACGTGFDNALPDVAQCNVNNEPLTQDGVAGTAKRDRWPCRPRDFKQVAQQALRDAQEYTGRAGSAANMVPLFDLGLIGTAVLGVTSAVFDWSRSITAGAGIGGGAIGAVSAYVSPRERAKIFASGAEAMQCIATVADSLDDRSVPDSQGARGQTMQFRAFAMARTAVATGRLSATTRGVIVQAETDAGLLLEELRNAMARIRTRIMQRVSDASAAPNAGALATSLTGAAETYARAVKNADNAAEDVRLDTNSAEQARETREALTIVATAKLKIAGCLALAGATST